MELWIRSQDKTRLGKIELIEYQEDDYGFYLFGWKDKFEGTRLATYKTKERALEVLDEIQCHLVNINDSRDSYFYVYEMPKE